MTIKEEIQIEEYKRTFAEAYKQGFIDAMSVCKTEPTISKMEQVDKDINVRSKEEAQTDKEIVLDPSFAELSDEQFVKAMKLIEPQTERHLPDYSYEADFGRRIMEQTERSE